MDYILNRDGVAFNLAHFGQASEEIWFDNARCKGNETYISQCSTNGWGIHDCTHNEDAGVRCGTSFYISIYIITKTNYDRCRKSKIDTLKTQLFNLFETSLF